MCGIDLAAKDVLIVDTRSPRQYSGEEGEEIRKGHIPGARNLFWETTLEGAEVRVWRKIEDLEKLAAAVGGTRNREIIVYFRDGKRREPRFLHAEVYPRLPQSSALQGILGGMVRG